MFKTTNVLEWANSHPRKLFLLDALGAVTSAILLGIVLVKLEWIFGIPESTLYFLAFLPCLFAIYDLYCFFQISSRVGIFLKGLAIINLSYCCLSIGLATYHYEKITIWGWTYILLEILIVTLLAIIELKTANQLIRSPNKVIDKL